MVINRTAGKKEAKSHGAVWEYFFVPSAHLTKSDIKLIQSGNHLSCFKQIDLWPHYYIF